MKKRYPLKIYPDPVLRKISGEVGEMNAGVRSLIDGMAAVMYAHNGIGLAAPQVGSLRRVIIADTGKGLIAMTNPRVMAGFGEDILDEGCLSLPDVRVNVSRQSAVFVRYLDLHGNETDREVTGLTGRVVQHEIDHLNGILIIDHGPAMNIIHDGGENDEEEM
ncbi:MAG: peptide deformylase [Bacteroidota bacterium]